MHELSRVTGQVRYYGARFSGGKRGYVLGEVSKKCRDKQHGFCYNGMNQKEVGD